MKTDAHAPSIQGLDLQILSIEGIVYVQVREHSPEVRVGCCLGQQLRKKQGAMAGPNGRTPY